MALFQTSVLKKYLHAQDQQEVDKAYKKFVKYFHDPKIQENIRSSKEEEYQGIFLTELFVKILGYTMKPNANYNLVAEYKNEKNSKKADGAILKEGVALGVIELKGTNTKDLEKVRQQAFDYKANQSGCVYVITSNFEKIRFYINNAVDFKEFDLFTLNEAQFYLLYLCLAKDNILADLPLKIKTDSLQVEESITKKFYADYSLFKRALFRDLVKLNMKNEVFRGELNRTDSERATKNIKQTLFKKSQKLIDRFLFIFFAEDRGLLPPNSAIKILEQWDKLKDLDAYAPLYDRYKLYFSYLDQGRKGTDKHAEIFAYNGGLFEPDSVLDSLMIGDELLYKHTKQLSNYDFESQVDVNILGHIFENSLNEIEGVNAEIEGRDFDKQKTKRKKDGIFYTPKYITKYIVDNTVGKLCAEKKTELALVDEDFTKSRKGRAHKRILELQEKLDMYRKWLLQLTILDPACGSGAFLNQALDFLIKEHEYVDELQTALMGGGLVFPNIDNTILENNIYGVDLNEESMEIAKLSLWLRTAQPRRKLNNLSSNIKCGNSLIDDKKVAGDKAFNWEEEFPEIFAKGGFDVVIGNPPYLRVQGLRENFEKESEHYEKKFQSATGRFDVYVLFMEKSFQLIKDDGIVSFILPHKFLVSDFGVGIRKFFVENKAVDSLVHFGSEMVFDDASAYTCIINLTQNNSELKFKQLNPNEIFDHFTFDLASYRTLSKERWNLKGESTEAVFQKLNKQPLRIKEIFSAIRTGVDTGTDDIFILKGKIKGGKFIGYSERLEKDVVLEANSIKPMLKGKDVRRYDAISNDHYVIYPHYEVAGKTKPYEELEFEELYPNTFKYLSSFKDELIKKKIHKKTNPKYWYSLHRAREKSIFEQLKIVTPETSLGGNLSIDHRDFYHNTQVYSLIKNVSVKEDYRFWLAILNSNVFWFYLQQTGAVLRGGYFRFKTKYLEPFPLPKLKYIDLQQPFIEKVDLMFANTKDFQRIVNKFTNYLQSQFSIEKLPKKLQNWHEIEFGEFISELNKAIKKVGGEKLSKMDEMEWMEVFETKRGEALALKAEIDKTDKEIDQMVYELYGLSEEEIKIVEGIN